MRSVTRYQPARASSAPTGPPARARCCVDQEAIRSGAIPNAESRTSAASIPLALADAVADRRIKRGHLILLEAMGGGFTWGAALIRW